MSIKVIEIKECKYTDDSIQLQQAIYNKLEGNKKNEGYELFTQYTDLSLKLAIVKTEVFKIKCHKRYKNLSNDEIKKRNLSLEFLNKKVKDLSTRLRELNEKIEK